MTAVRDATRADLRPISVALARAFEDDPVFTWVFGEGPTRLDRTRRFFEMEGRRHLACDRVLTTDGAEAAAYWAPPGQWRPSVAWFLRTLVGNVRTVGRRLPTAVRGLQRMERAHPHEPHWYLAVLGTDPAHQGKGFGGALMAPVLDECDRQGLGAYLESSKDRNVPYYRRHGFELVEELELAAGVPVWRMWRDPRP